MVLQKVLFSTGIVEKRASFSDSRKLLLTLLFNKNTKHDSSGKRHAATVADKIDDQFDGDGRERNPWVDRVFFFFSDRLTTLD